MNTKYILFFFLTSITICKGQSIKVENGILINSYKNNLNLDILNLNTVSYFTSIGFDYIEKERTSLSSQIGYFQQRGKEKFSDGIKTIEILEKTNYVHLNTTFRYSLFRKKEDYQIFIGAGPYVNLLLGDKSLNSFIYRNFYNYNSLYFGGKPEVGITKEINKLKIGLISHYMFNLTPSIKSEGIKLNNNSYIFNITASYELK